MLKSRFDADGQVQRDVGDEVTMRDARVAVVPCKPPFNAVFDFEFSRSHEDCSSFVRRWHESLTAKVTVLRR